MTRGYTPVASGEQDFEPSILQDQLEQRQPDRKSVLSWPLLILTLLLTNLMAGITGYSFSSLNRQQTALQVDALPDTAEKPFRWITPYSAADNGFESGPDELWDKIQPSHGFIAIDRNWARAHGWPESMYLPSDRSKGVYLLEAYHYLHCLKILRKTFWEAVHEKPYTHTPGAHTDHCFDALRQYVICNADATPLYTFGDFTAGDGQSHLCKNWSQLRDYATNYTPHFGYCDDGDDGVIELS
ncbi:hypothetical protein BDV06DRAFT_217085 [Aspergillus oleicola]